jgi:hypothetical protein
MLAERPDAEPQFFSQTGFTLAVLEPGKPSGMYHAESSHEDFLTPRIGGSIVCKRRAALLHEAQEQLARGSDLRLTPQSEARSMARSRPHAGAPAVRPARGASRRRQGARPAGRCLT